MAGQHDRGGEKRHPAVPSPPIAAGPSPFAADRTLFRVGLKGRTVDPEARKPAIKMWIDFGDEIGEKKTSAQLTAHYTPDSLLGKQVIAVVNFPPRQIGPFMSEVLVLGLPDAEGNVVLLGPDREVPPGGRMH